MAAAVPRAEIALSRRSRRRPWNRTPSSSASPSRSAWPATSSPRSMPWGSTSAGPWSERRSGPARSASSSCTSAFWRSWWPWSWAASSSSARSTRASARTCRIRPRGPSPGPSSSSPSGSSSPRLSGTAGGRQTPGGGEHRVEPGARLNGIGIDHGNRDVPALRRAPHDLGATAEQLRPHAARRLVDDAPDRRVHDLLHQPLEPRTVYGRDRFLVAGGGAHEPEHERHVGNLVEDGPHTIGVGDGALQSGHGDLVHG